LDHVYQAENCTFAAFGLIEPMPIASAGSADRSGNWSLFEWTVCSRRMIGMAVLMCGRQELPPDEQNRLVTRTADDAQWLDEATRDVLSFVYGRLSSDPIVLVLAVGEGFDLTFGNADTLRHIIAALRNADAARLLDVQAQRFFLAPEALWQLRGKADHPYCPHGPNDDEIIELLPDLGAHFCALSTSADGNTSL
jgi:hypothetical protein